MLAMESSLSLLLFAFVAIILGGVLIRFLLPALSGMKHKRRRRRRHSSDNNRVPEPRGAPGPGLEEIVAGMQAAERRVAEQSRRKAGGDRPERPRQPGPGPEGPDPVAEASAAVVEAWRNGGLSEAHIARLEQALRARTS